MSRLPEIASPRAPIDLVLLPRGKAAAPRPRRVPIDTYYRPRHFVPAAPRMARHINWHGVAGVAAALASSACVVAAIVWALR